MNTKNLAIKFGIFSAVLTLLLVLFAVPTSASSEFITTWNTANPGTSNSRQISIPVNQDADYNYFVNWGDGQTDSNVTSAITHTYDDPGIYTVTISGQFPRIQFNNGGDKLKILSVEQWGSNAWQSLESSFYGATNLVINAVDTPNLSQVTSMANAFRNARSIETGFENWNVSNVEVFGRMFYGAREFNSDISNWNMSNARNTEYMFFQTLQFNQPLIAWDLSSATILTGMFSGASSFNQPINSWDLSSAFNIEMLFKNNASFDQPVGSLPVGSLRFIDELLSGTTLSTANYDSTLQKWRDTETQKNVAIDAGNSVFCVANEARDYLVNELNWTIYDGGYDGAFCGDVDISFTDTPFIEENAPIGTSVGVLAVESSAGGSFSLSLTCTTQSSSDSQLFNLSGNELLSTQVFDYENPADANTDNSFEVCIRISNGENSVERTVTFTLQDVEDAVTNTTDPVQDGSVLATSTATNSDDQSVKGGQVLGTAEEKNESKTGQVLAASGVAISLIVVAVGFFLSSSAGLSLRKKLIRK